MHHVEVCTGRRSHLADALKLVDPQLAHAGRYPPDGSIMRRPRHAAGQVHDDGWALSALEGGQEMVKRFEGVARPACGHLSRDAISDAANVQHGLAHAVVIGGEIHLHAAMRQRPQ